MTDSRLHPAARELAAFARDGLAVADRKRVSRHLAECWSCRRIVSDLHGESGGGDEELEVAWSSLRSRIDFPGPSRKRGWLAAAAAFGAILLAAAVWLAATAQGRLEEARRRIVQLEASLAEARVPHAAVAAVDLVPRGALRNGGEVAEFRIEPGTRLVLLRLLLTGSGAGERHRLVARDEAGRLLWTVEEVRTDSAQRADIALPVGRIPEGTVDLALVREGDGQSDLAARYTLRVHRSEGEE